VTDKPLTGRPGVTWKLGTNPNINAVDPQAVQTNANQAPDTSTIFAPLNNTPNLTALAVEGRNAITNAKNQATTLISQSRSSLKTSMNSSLDTVKSNLVNSLTPVQTDVGTTISGVKSQVTSYFVQANQFNDFRVYGQMGLVLLYVLPLMFMNLGGLSRRPGCMKTCNLVCVPYYLLLYLFGILFLLLAAVMGDVCTLVFDTRPSPLAQFNPTIGAAVDAIDSCYAGVSLLSVVGSLNLGFNSSQLNMSSIARAEINKFNLTSMANFDLG
jgi:hypothetical protein